MNLASMQQGIKKLQWFDYSKVVFLKIINMLLCCIFRQPHKTITYVPMGIKYFTGWVDSCGKTQFETQFENSLIIAYILFTPLKYRM